MKLFPRRGKGKDGCKSSKIGNKSGKPWIHLIFSKAGPHGLLTFIVNGQDRSVGEYFLNSHNAKKVFSRKYFTRRVFNKPHCGGLLLVRSGLHQDRLGRKVIPFGALSYDAREGTLGSTLSPRLLPASLLCHPMWILPSNVKQLKHCFCWPTRLQLQQKGWELDTPNIWGPSQSTAY